MSDTETEQTVEAHEAPSDAEAAAVIAAYNETPDDDDDDEREPEPAPQLEDPEASGDLGDEELRRIQTERELAKRDQRLDGENARHAKRVGEIMDEAAGDLIPCPVCMDGIAGWIYPPDVQQLGPDAIARVRQVIGLPDYTTFHAAAFATECPDCGGLGEVTTGSHVPGREVTTCETCQKAGWIRTRDIQRLAHVDAETGEILTGPTVYTGDEGDTEIANLRQRGYTVIPPMQAAGV
jgi:hypothetical protein